MSAQTFRNALIIFPQQKNEGDRNYQQMQEWWLVSGKQGFAWQEACGPGVWVCSLIALRAG